MSAADPIECGVCDGVGGQRDMLTGDWLECWRCEGLGVLPRAAAADPTAELVDCPACRGQGTVLVISRWFGARCPDCGTCEGRGEITAARAHDLAREAAEARAMSDDDRAHARRKRRMEAG